MKKSELRKIIKEVIQEQLGTGGGYPTNPPNPGPVGVTNYGNTCPPHVFQAAEMMMNKMGPRDSRKGKLWAWIKGLFTCDGHGHNYDEIIDPGSLECPECV